MIKNVLKRCIIGAPLGVGISTMITVIISIIIGDGQYYPVVPELVNECGNELTAIILQTVCSLLYGAAWAGASFIWEQEDWSLLRQTLTHLAVASLATFPGAYCMYWMKHSVQGVLMYFGIFFIIYLFIWLSQYIAMKKKIRQLNIEINKQ